LKEVNYFRVGNQTYRDEWCESQLRAAIARLREHQMGLSLIDVGAGQMPYRGISIKLGFDYKSHDFNKYDAASGDIGLHSNWPMQSHDFTCDILQIPTTDQFNVVLCTEVLEHVPDPVAAMRHLERLLAPGGYMIVTAPLLSLIHQAPYHFSSGLTPFWYKYWFSELGLEGVEVGQHGDYADLSAQELRRFFFLPGILQKPLARFAAILLARRRSLLSSGGFSIFAVARKPD
jgi:SAM-dependent methyltransferase